MLPLHELISQQGWPADTQLIPFGSQVYGTARPDSDTDLIVVFLSGDAPGGDELTIGRYNLQTYTLAGLCAALDDHQINALEAYFVPESCLRAHYTFTMNHAALRRSLAQKSSHSFVKAKKKIAVEQDFRAGWKSLFHSLRILVFGIELAQTGRLTEFSAANAYWEEIWAAQETDWARLQTRWQPVHNVLSSEFRRFAPKE
jgi:Nucleotidyltransferase domain